MSNKSRRGTSKPRTNLSRNTNVRRRLRDKQLMEHLQYTEAAGNKALKARKAAEAAEAQRVRAELPGVVFDEHRRVQEVNYTGRGA